MTVFGGGTSGEVEAGGGWTACGECTDGGGDVD